MSRVLLLDLDHTLYPSTLPTAPAVDSRITEYIRRHLNVSAEEADALRQNLWRRYGTTLKGLETLHGVNRDHYCDFIQDLDDASMPPPDPVLREWLIAAGGKIPTYLFTNARGDWAHRCLTLMGLSDLLTAEPPVLRGILDIGFLDWIGKPDIAAFAKTEQHVRDQHGDVRMIFADDRLDNLEQARVQGWFTIWVRPHDMDPKLGAAHRVVDSLIELDVETLL